MTNHPNRSTAMRLTKIAAELDKLSPELRDLLATALTGANGEKPIADARTQDMARMRINEALTRWTANAQSWRKAG